MKASEFLKEKTKQQSGGSAQEFLNRKTYKSFKKEDYPQLQTTQKDWDKVSRTLLPIAFDIAGSVAAPQFAIPHGLGTAATRWWFR
jgi:hypothetical protein